MMTSQNKSILNMATLLKKLYEEAGSGLWQPENKEYEEHNREYIFQYIAVRLVDRVKPVSNASDYSRGYASGYKAGRRSASKPQTGEERKQ